MLAPPPDAPAPDPPARRGAGRARRAVFVAAAGLLLAGALGLALHFGRRPEAPPPPAPARDPRLDYAGPFRNIDPSVRYVSEEGCGDCHADQAVPFRDHPMGRSLLPVAEAPSPPEDAAHHNPFDALDSQFLVERRDGRVSHRRRRLDAAGRPVVEMAREVHYVIGSGTHGHSYLTGRDGFLFQTPISWYARKGAWGLSPGFGPALLTGRPIRPDCLFCHANRANYRAGSVNRYGEPAFDGHAIGCQRCHGPAELHLARLDRGEKAPGGVDYTIVNPKRLDRPPRDAVCEQCHLEGEARVLRRGRGLYDFRPGLPLGEFLSVFVRGAGAGEGRKAVSHVEQMYESRCYRGAGPQPLGCVSCHDPHRRVAPAGRVAHYRRACLACHEQRGCSVPLAERVKESKEDSCIDCHMPRYSSSDIPHAASTDHRILRDGMAAARAAPPPGDGRFPLVSFYRGRDGAEDERDLALAVVRRAREGGAADLRPVRQALPALESALRRDADDVPAREAQGFGLGLDGRQAEALAAFEAVLAAAPEREESLVGAAAAAEALGRTDDALGYWRRAVAANPQAPDYRRRLVLLLVKGEAWGEAGREGREWVRLDPASAEARAARVACLLAAGDKGEARAEFARVEALAPDNLAELRARFARKLR